jgi:hypothetical protein
MASNNEDYFAFVIMANSEQPTATATSQLIVLSVGLGELL